VGILEKAVIVAHPDDELLGCFSAFPAKLLILGRGRGDDLDNQFDKMPLLYWVQQVEKFLTPEITDVYTHDPDDINIDHQKVFEAVRVACRPFASKVKNIYTCEIPGSTYFVPNLFVPIDVKKKWQSLKKYKGEMRENPHPRSREKIKALAEVRGMQAGVEAAEAFRVFREIR